MKHGAIVLAIVSGWVLAPMTASAQHIDRVKMTDGELTCAQIHAEVGEMDLILGQAKGSAQTSQNTAVAADAASAVAPVANALGGFSPFGGLFGQAAGRAAAQVASSNAQAASQRASQAAARKEHLTQLFLSKGCKTSDLNYAGQEVNVAAIAQAGVASDGAGSGLPKPMTVADLKGLADAPIDLTGIDYSGRTDLMTGGAKLQGRVFVPSFRVAFAIKGTVKASQRETYFLGRTTAGQVMITDSTLTNIDFALMQAITDRAYKDFLDRLTAIGVTVLPAEEWSQAPSAAKLDWGKRSEDGAPYVVDTALGYTEQTYVVFTPTGVRNWPETSMPANLGTVRAMTKELNATLLVPRYAVNYAFYESSGRGGTLFATRDVSTGVNAIMNGGAVGGGFSFDATGIRVGEHGGRVGFKSDKPFIVEDRFGELREIKGDDPYAASNALSSAIWYGTNYGATFRKKTFYAMEADPAAYAKASLKLLAAYNAASVEALAKGK